MRLNRLVLEFDAGAARSLYFYVIYSNIKSRIAHMFASRKYEQDYPVDIKRVVSMCKLEFIGDKVFIGYRPESYRTELEQNIYKTILDLEYGYNGHEVRIIRKVLEGVKLNVS